jgi:hypothetical protein
MSKRRTEIDVKLLLYAINKTYQFQDLLGKRFNGSTLEETLGVKSGKTGEKKMKTEKEIDHSPTQTAGILLPPSPFGT